MQRADAQESRQGGVTQPQHTTSVVVTSAHSAVVPSGPVRPPQLRPSPQLISQHAVANSPPPQALTGPGAMAVASRPLSATDSAGSASASGAGRAEADKSGSFRFATPHEIRVRLHRRFPDVDPETLTDLAHAVALNRYSYADAKRMLQELSSISTVQQAVVEAIQEERERDARLQAERARRYEEEYERQQRSHEAAKLRRASDAPNGGEDQGNRPARVASAMLPNAAPDVDSAVVGPTDCVLYVTSMTSSRQVRDHCRLLQQLLYLRRVKHTVLDVADNAYLQRRLMKMVSSSRPELAAGMSHLPLVFVGESFVGDYTHCQRLEDDGVFLAALQAYGFVYVPQPLHRSNEGAVAPNDSSTRDMFAGDDFDL